MTGAKRRGRPVISSAVFSSAPSAICLRMPWRAVGRSPVSSTWERMFQMELRASCKAVADELLRGVEMMMQGLGICDRLLFGEAEMHGSGGEPLREGVVDFAGDAVAFGENGGEFGFGHGPAMGLFFQAPARQS
jgi:hypothetical protein